MKNFLVFSFLFLALGAYAQMPQQRGNTTGGGHFYGKVVDSKTNKGIEAASVILLMNIKDTATNQNRDVVVRSVLSKANGDFNLDDIAPMGKYTLRVDVIGYAQYSSPIKFDQGNIDKDLGNIKLTEDATTLSTVTVTSQKQFFQMGVDRKIFNVDQNIVTQGQMATEIMRNIPSLSVDIDGNVTLRNSTPQIFVDGRPTTLTLDQIPADIIESVELITNPSAKYDASGGNAGILNIVLKKNKRTGYNGGIRTGIDSRGGKNFGGDINLRQGKVNFFLSGSYNERKGKNTGKTDRNNLGSNPSFVHQENEGLNDGNFGFIRGGLDYFMDNRNTLTLAVNANKGKFENSEDQSIDSLLNNNLISYSNRDVNTVGNFKNFGTQLGYKHNFAKQGHELTADVNYNSSENDNNGTFITRTYGSNNSLKYNPVLQRSSGEGTNKFTTAQIDYANPISKDTKFEAGVRMAVRNFENNNLQSVFDYALNDYVPINSVNARYKFTDNVYAAYGTYSFKVNKFSYQLGLRAESSNYEGTLLDNNTKFNVDFPISLFPSAFITYKASDNEDIQLNYSRRINRPNFFQLSPFVDFSDPQNINVGNAGLKPEFTNSFEVSYNNSYKRNANFLASVYAKVNNDLITRFQYKDVSPDPNVSADSVIFNTYANANSSQTFGIELTNRMPIVKNWDATVNFNLFNSKIDGGNIENNLSQQLTSWFVKFNNAIKLPNSFSIQLSADYYAKTVLPQEGGRGRGGPFGGGSQASAQGYIKPRYSFDFAIRKEWTWKGGNSINASLSINDFMRTQLNQSYSESIYFTQDSERRRNPQLVRFNLNYRFGKFDVNLFKRKNNRNSGDDGGGEMMGGGM